jgi:hypothetical protein
MRDTIEDYFKLQQVLRELLINSNNTYLKVCGINALLGKLNIEYISLVDDKLIVSMGDQQTSMEVDILDDELIIELNNFLKTTLHNLSLFMTTNYIISK